MQRLFTSLWVAQFALLGTVLEAQSKPPNIVGTWRVNTPDGPREVIIRPDSSASFGAETVRWRLGGDSVFLAFGDEWVSYAIRLKSNELTVWGGDLEEPMTLKRIGPPTPRPDSVLLPPAPPINRPGSPPARKSGSRP